jgi:branched-chain amino acid transport system substrate-binding protein
VDGADFDAGVSTGGTYMRARVARIVAVTMALLLLVAACGNSGDDDDDSAGGSNDTTVTTGEVDLSKNVPVDAPGVTDSEIHVAVISSKTNPLNGKYAEIADGMNAYFDMVNEDGGIYGRQLKITSERDDIIGTQNNEQVQASLAEDNVFATFLATLQFTGANALQAAGMPTFMWNINPEMANKDNIFANSGALCFGCTGQIGPYIAKQLKATKVGVLGYGISEQSKLCAQGVEKSFEKYPTADVVFYDDTIGFAQADLSAQVAQMKDKGVDFVQTCMDINEVIVLGNEMKKQGLNAVQQLPNGYDKELVANNADVLEGSIVVPQFQAFEQDPQIPEIETYLAQMKKIGKDPIEVATMGWILADQFVTGLKLAGPEFTQQKVIDGLNSQTDYSANGFVQPIDWTKQHNDPATDESARGSEECANFTQVKSGKFVAVWGQPGKPWACFKTDAPTLGEPTFKTFEPGDDGNS